MNRRKLIGELLSLLERKESRLLGWGFLDVSFSAEEIVDAFRQADREYVEALDEWFAETTTELFVDDLAEANLLTRVEGGRYRSRFAESVRLFARLRQRFSQNDWATAPQLVSDVKIHLSARQYPKRNVLASDAWEQIKEACWATPVQRLVFDALTKDGGKELSFAGFQVRATQRILSHYQPANKSAGTVISAGTGSGKTKAFYLPAFMGIAADIAKDDRSFMKALAIYPRNVLLADQFTEAVAQGLLLEYAGGALPRRVTFGAFLGDTPHSRDLRPGVYALKNWKQTNQGWIPPFIKHPRDGSDLIWIDSDRRAGRTTLRSASNQDQVVVPDGMIRLTRDLIRQRPPDILMMSVEMLNKEISSPINAALLGFKANLPPPRLLLLDEVHTYEGTSGAQVPWILRRWSYWVKRWRSTESSVHFVGLSATLREAPLHLSTLVGTHESSVAEIKPEASIGELESEGAEYNVALKSHAGSGASVLATSIQTAMLGARLLTPAHHEQCRWNENTDHLAPQCFFGRKVFGFTDNLDSLNRWIADFVDADRNRRLSRFRATGVPDFHARNAEGQVWSLSEGLGHDLNQALNTSRCSSQDPGVDSRSDVVIATSSLEVGYDDPHVGMVVHHKAPRSAASFLQRKGRAGRLRGIRPWTIVVFSDYGRDRWAFRDSERIFHPELDALKIPALNPYVVRVQATQFLIDWIGNKVKQGQPYRYLARPQEPHQDAAKQLLMELVTDENRRGEFIKDFTYWLRGAAGGLKLGDPEDLADSVLWDPPRAVLRHAIPELAKVLAGAFRPLGVSEPIEQKRPLPRFIPAVTWGELDAQDVEIKFGDGSEPRAEDVAFALREASPCRVSRRYAVGVNQSSLWHDYSGTILANKPERVAVASLFPDSLSIGNADGVELYQPYALQLVAVPNNVKDSSSASWEWQYRTNFVGNSERLGLVDGPVLSRVFSACDGYFHSRYAHAVVTRFASQFKYEVVLDKGVKHRGMMSLAREGGEGETVRQAVGFRRSVDAIRFKIDAIHIAAVPVLDDAALQTLRPLYFRYRLSTSPVLRAMASSFGISALWNSAVSMLTTTALLRKTTLQEAATLLDNRSGAARKVLECLLLGEEASDLTDPSTGGGGLSNNRRIREVQELWEDDHVREEVCRLERVLWETRVEEVGEWAVQIYLETLRSALEQAIWTVVPEIPEGDISVDITSSEDGYALVLSEVASGGVGHLERLVVEIGQAQERFDSAFEAAIRSCENDRLSRLVRSSVALAKGTLSDMSAAFEQVRSAVSFNDLDVAKNALIENLDKQGLATDRAAISALVAKVLRPGSSRATDLWVRSLGRRRAMLSDRLGISLDQRMFAYWCVQNDALNRRMHAYLREIGQHDPTPAQVLNAFAQLTVLGCRDSCPECLGVRNELEGLSPSRWLAKSWIDLDSIDLRIDVDQSSDWKGDLVRALREANRIKLAFGDAQRSAVAMELSSLLAEEHDRGYIFSPFTTVAATRNAYRWELTLQPSGELAD